MTRDNGRLRVALVGCGAISQQCHAPVLAGCDEVRFAACVDKNENSARRLARVYGVTTVLRDVNDLDKGMADAAILATPPSHHAPAAIALLTRGIHVLVEKPMALNAGEAVEMAQAARDNNAVLSVGFVRRLFPSSRLAKGILAGGWLGRPLRFDFEEGDVFNWPLGHVDMLTKAVAGGGVLMDTGPHLIDQLLFFLPGSAELLSYEDNALGGVETDCRLCLRVVHEGRAVEGRMELSRTRRLRNTLRIECERGVVECVCGERHGVSVTMNHLRTVDALESRERPCLLTAKWKDERESSILGAFRTQLDAWRESISLRRENCLSAESAIPTVRLIDECYAARRPLSEPWRTEEPRRDAVSSDRGERSEDGEEESPLASPRSRSRRGRRPRALITGAGGFVGGRVAEILCLREGYDVRALIHRPGGAGRVASLPVELVQGDLRSPSSLVKAVEGCDVVVHCAYGTSWGDARQIRAVTVEGTKNLAFAALRANVSRFVHLSTWAIHGHVDADDVDETTPIMPGRDLYAVTKAKAEKAVSRAAQAGLPAIILRPTNVYGPFSGPFTVRPVRDLIAGMPMYVGAGEQPSNTVFVDNLTEAIVKAIDAPDRAIGEAFLIDDDNGFSWADYHGRYARMLGLTMRSLSVSEMETLRGATSRDGVFSRLGAGIRAMKEIGTSRELLDFGKKILATDPVGCLPRALLNRCGWIDNGLRRLFRTETAEVFVPNEHAAAATPSLGLMELYTSRAKARIEKARRMLDFSPRVPPDRAMELTLEWVRHARLGER